MTFQVFGNDHIFIRVWRIIDHADCEVAFRLNHLLPCRGEVADFARAVIAVCASRIPGNAYRAVFFSNSEDLSALPLHAENPLRRYS
jgi:hypothetical protein